MTKPLTMWCVKSPAGQLISFTLSRLQRQAKEQAYFGIPVDGIPHQQWSAHSKEGYTVVRVKVEEIGD